MSRDIIILTPNGRRIKVHCTADTNILQVLEDVCSRQGYQSEEFDLKHHNKVLDLTTTIRFCNLPNKATLEMVETDKKRIESNVVIGLHLEDGERKTGDFPSKTTLFDLVSSLAPDELIALKNPTIMYMRQEVIGISALKEKTLRQLGLLTGRAILRLLDKAKEPIQANVSSVYRRQTEKDSNKASLPNENTGFADNAIPGPSNVTKGQDFKTVIDPVKFLKNEMALENSNVVDVERKKDSDNKGESNSFEDTSKMDVDKYVSNETLDVVTEETKYRSRMNPSSSTQESLERRLKIEDEVTFLGPNKAIAFMQPDNAEEEMCDLPDDFYELTIEEVRKMYHELQQRRIELENTPLITADKRADIDKQSFEEKVNIYKNAVVRIQFPDNFILQGVFSPTNTIGDITHFVKEYLYHPEKPFRIFTTPLKQTLDSQTTLLAAGFVPCVHMHFKWLEEDANQKYLKDEVYKQTTSSDAASILASKYRAPSRRKQDDFSNKTNPNQSTSKQQSKVPKWFK